MAAQPEDQTLPPVSITNKVFVHSKALHPPNILELSNLDRQCPTLMYVVFFYKSSQLYEEISMETVFDHLKTSLEKTLSIWYPAAGRLNINPGDGKLNILCNNAGVILVEALTQAMISNLGDLSVYNEFYEKLVFKPEINRNIMEMPLLIAQVTKFCCGGYSLGIGMSHSLFDGVGGCDFLSAWASHFDITNRSSVSQLYEPVHQRSRLFIDDDSKDEPVAAIDHLYQMIKENNSSQEENQISDDEKFVITTFHFSASMIESLKKKMVVKSENGVSFSCSSFEVLAAHLWKVRTRSLGLNQDKMVCLQFSIDVRNKMASCLPKGFSGNAYVLASISSTTKELEEESYEYIINKIKDAKKSVNDDYVNSYMKSLEGPQASLPCLHGLTMISDWTKLAYQNVDFFGEVSCVAPLVAPIPQLAYFMPNPNQNGGIDVKIGLLPKNQDAFAHLFVKDL